MEHLNDVDRTTTEVAVEQSQHSVPPTECWNDLEYFVNVPAG